MFVLWLKSRTGGSAPDGPNAGASTKVAVEPGRDRGLPENVPGEPRWEAWQRPRRKRWRYFMYGQRPEPLPSFRGPVEEPEDRKLGICCSGGGIRSAAFNLGALQSLQKAGELERATYLAAVSGGSYIAAAFSMVAKTWPDGTSRPGEGTEHHDDSDPELIRKCAPFDPGSPEEQYLRNRSSYLAPDGMGKLSLANRILLGIVFNLLFLSMPLFAVALALAEFWYRPRLPQLLGACEPNCAANIPRAWWIVPLVILGGSILLGLWGMITRPGSDLRSSFLETWSTRALLIAGGLALLLIAVPAIVEAFHSSVPAADSSTGAPEIDFGVVGGGAGLAGLIAGVLGQLRQAFATPKKAFEELTKTQQRVRNLSTRARVFVAYLAGALIGPLLLMAVFVFGVSFALANSAHSVNWWIIALAGGALALFLALYAWADITSWSLHPLYRRRLSTAFALKRISSADMTADERNRAEALPPVEPPDPELGIAIERDFDNLVRLSGTAVQDRSWPTLLVCAAANVSDPGATPPGRHVTSFTFSPHTIGSPLVGAAPTATFENVFDKPEHTGWREKFWGALTSARRRVFIFLPKERRRQVQDITLPAAVAMSGAALSPSMGKMTHRPLTFLLALANIRLGVWVPNPGWVMALNELDESKRKRRLRAFGRPRPSYLLRELLGRNRVGERYLYVTDGGHYENLGLVELLRRGCTEIYCFDASGGEGFEVLGDAVALARSELDVDIDIKPDDLFPRTKDADEKKDANAKEEEGTAEIGEAKQDAVRATFTYRDREGDREIKGTMVYARNVMTAKVPWDVKAYHKTDPSFPHHSTADQLYTDQKFEGYRVLGERAGGHAVKLMRSVR